MKLINNLIDKLNNYLGPVIFYNGNLFSYNIYNFFFKKNIMNKNYQNNHIISEYMKNGYVKLDSIPPHEIDELTSLLDKYNPLKIQKDYTYSFVINDELLSKIKDIINKNY